MSLVVGVRFAQDGKLHYFDPGDLELDCGDEVLVETQNGPETACVVFPPQQVEVANTLSPLKKVIEKVEEPEPEEKKEQPRDKEKEQAAFRVAEEKIRRREMQMKLIDVEYALDGSKIIFYFAAEGRVDFRELVKDLASIFKTRIELRQIGVRDEAKKVGGLGPCGRPCCCNSFLEDFVPVSIKMAKEQNLSLSPTKISGLCGRLMCCLHYEQETYHEMRSQLPVVGSRVRTVDGPGEVCEVEVLTGHTKVKVELPDGSFELRTYPLSDIRFRRRGMPETDEADEPFERKEPQRPEPKLNWKLEMDDENREPEPAPKREPRGRRSEGSKRPQREKGQRPKGRAKSAQRDRPPRGPRPQKRDSASNSGPRA